MLYLLDSDCFIFLMRQDIQLQTKAQQVGLGSIAISIITQAEVLFGAYNAANPAQNLAYTRSFVGQFQVIDLNEAIVDKYGEMRAAFKKSGQSLPNFDLLIGATAIIEQRVLVTSNLKHFNRMAQFGLVTENWKT